ncbi:MAG: CopD family protein [Gammaproteobacteria bacterium]|nr:CopD family protein [Gammaproteobacteria bacterium]MBI5615905.1 CopD family protein [Gammaproteobacteria bacterium]
MELFLDVFAFAAVVLRGFVLTGVGVCLGGVLFAYLVALPTLDVNREADRAVLAKSARLIVICAWGLAIAAVAAAGIDVAVLISTVEIPWGSALTAEFAQAGELMTLAAIAVAVLAPAIARGERSVPLLVGAVALLVASVATTHAAARLEDRAVLLAASAMHQAGAAAWIGGIPFFLYALANHDGMDRRQALALRFSHVCAVAVGLILVSAAIKYVKYIGGVDAIYGTSYGMMSLTKFAMFASLLAFGAGNAWAVRRMAGDGALALRTRRFAEVELGVGITVFFCAASLTSQPPAVDLTQDRVSWDRVMYRVIIPSLPRIVSPDHKLLGVPQEQARLNQIAAEKRDDAPLAYVPGYGIPAPSTAADIEWSEYNHNGSGIFVFAIGLLALLYRTGKAPWANHWPLLFVVLAVLIMIRADPEAWPLGPIGFWESMRAQEVLQHRLATLLVAIFGILEWRVRNGGLGRSGLAYVFPVSNAIGGVLLLTHTHALANVQEALLEEMNHLPIGLLAMGAGYARWLELRGTPSVKRIAGWVWPLCFIGVGLVLMNYRES